MKNSKLNLIFPISFVGGGVLMQIQGLYFNPNTIWIRTIMTGIALSIITYLILMVKRQK